MDDAGLEPLFDPCPRRTRVGLPCSKPRYHIGNCHPADSTVDEYRRFVEALRVRCHDMTRLELERAAEFHLLAWKVCRDEFRRR